LNYMRPPAPSPVTPASLIDVLIRNHSSSSSSTRRRTSDSDSSSSSGSGGGSSSSSGSGSGSSSSSSRRWRISSSYCSNSNDTDVLIRDPTLPLLPHRAPDTVSSVDATPTPPHACFDSLLAIIPKDGNVVCYALLLLRQYTALLQRYLQHMTHLTVHNRETKTI